jgi:hypothetical protein
VKVIRGRTATLPLRRSAFAFFPLARITSIALRSYGFAARGRLGCPN